MQQSGLVEIPNPSEILLSTGDSSLSGIAVAVAINGSRPLLIETQALVSTAAYGTPQRSATGFDAKRLNMLLAVLEKRAGFHLSTRDVFLNIAGGLKIQDPATDLAVICAVLSSSANISIDKKYSFSAEISLSGEIRPVNRVDQRILEAEKLGFEKIFIARSQKTVAQKKRNIEIVDVNKVEDIVKKLFS
jgi:DNA repair protein RadA/Sms